MARGDQLGRQWRIIQTLLTSKLGKSAAELADDLDCNPRTVYRDLEALQVAGFPIYTERIDGKNLWSLLDTMKHQLPIPFNLMELMALYFSRDMLKVFKDTVFYDSLESLFHKIKTTLPGESLELSGPGPAGPPPGPAALPGLCPVPGDHQSRAARPWSKRLWKLSISP